jgi:predicted MPP superfamily phosphohydrolase
VNDSKTVERRPLVFVHLSDLHFREAGSPLADREASLRDLLMEDIPKVVARTGGPVEAVLLTGDIARAGQAEEYRAARAWLDRLCDRLGIHTTKTLTVPGNHDVDWKQLDPEPGRKAINQDLRTCAEHLLDSKIDELLLKHPDVVMAPLANYQEFAAAYACDISKCLAWDLPPIPLGGGFALAMRGANTVINSDGEDGEGTMAVQMNQLLVPREPGVVRLLMLHHDPKFWRRAKPTPALCGHNIVLYGHTHEAKYRRDGSSCLEITAGAIHPEEKEQFAIPGYNVLEVSVEAAESGETQQAVARVRVFHRDFSRADQMFVDAGPDPTVDERLEISNVNSGIAPATPMITSDAGDGPEASGEPEAQPPLESADGDPDPSRIVRHAFEDLGAGQRLRVLDRIGLERSVISGLQPHKQIREVAELVVERGLVDRFIEAVTEVKG